MTKNTFASIIFAATSIAIMSLFTQEVVAKKPLYLHQQNKTVRSNKEHLDQFITSGDVVLDFYADWCNPCKRMSPLIDTVAAILPQFTFIKIRRDDFMDLAKLYNITSIPTLIFLRDGKEIGRYDGGPLTEEKLEKIVLRAYAR
jgi:thioredoxin 1